MKKMETQGLLPITLAQDEILMDNEGSPEEYLKYSNMEGFLVIDRSGFSVQAMEQAWNRVVEENDSLRLQLFKTGLHTYMQRINPFVYQKLEITEVPDESTLRQTIEAYHVEYVMPDDPVLWKARLFKTKGEAGGIGIRILHVCTDGFSEEILTKRLLDVYDRLKKGEEVPQIKTYSYQLLIDSDQKYRNSEAFEKDRLYWKEFYRRQLFSNYCVPTGKRNFGGRAEDLSFKFGKALTNKVDQYCADHHVSIQSFLMSAQALAVYRLTGKNNFVIWNLTHGRQTFAQRKMTGVGTRTIPTQFLLKDGDTLEQMISDAFVNYLDSLNHSRYPMRKHIMLYMAKSILLGYNFAHNWMVFSSMLYESDHSLQKYEVGYFPDDITTSQFYSGLVQTEEAGYEIILSYISKDYSQKQVEKMFAVYRDTLNEIIEYPMKKIGDLSINRKYRFHRKH